MQICGDKTIQFLTQQYMFANVLVSLEGLRSAPAQCLKCKTVLRAQSFGCSICTAPQPWSMMMPITWQCGGQPCHQLLLINMEDKSISREWPTVRKMVKAWENFKLQSEAPWLLGCNRWPLLQMRDLQPDVFTREGGGAGLFLNWQTCVLNAAGRLTVNS